MVKGEKLRSIRFPFKQALTKDPEDLIDPKDLIKWRNTQKAKLPSLQTTLFRVVALKNIEVNFIFFAIL